MPQPVLRFRSVMKDGPWDRGCRPRKIAAGYSRAETATQFVHVLPRGQHVPAALSDYLTGENMPILDPLSQPRWFNELSARADDLLRLLSGEWLRQKK